MPNEVRAAIERVYKKYDAYLPETFPLLLRAFAKKGAVIRMMAAHNTGPVSNENAYKDMRAAVLALARECEKC